MQACDEIRKFAKYKPFLKVVPIYGGQPIERQFTALRGGAQIVVGTPGRVMDHMRRGTLKLDTLHMIILDEADEMLSMGFREDIETILKDVPQERRPSSFPPRCRLRSCGSQSNIKPTRSSLESRGNS